MTRTNETIGDRIRIAIKDARLTQRALAKHLGISESAMSNYVQNVAEPSAAGLAKIAEATGKSIDWLVTGSVIEEGTTTPRRIDLTEEQREILDAINISPAKRLMAEEMLVMEEHEVFAWLSERRKKKKEEGQ